MADPQRPAAEANLSDEPMKAGDKDVKFWQDQLRIRDDVQKFHDRSHKVVQRYRDVRDVYEDKAKRMNVFWANTGILKAALYANPPQPIVSRQFKDQNDDVARVAAEIMERLLNVGDEMPRSDMDTAFANSVEDRLIPGLGQIWLRYEPQIETVTTQAVPGVEGSEITYEEVVDENVITEYVYWRDFLWSAARVWEEVWWVARKVKMTPRQAEERFGAKKARKLDYKESNGARIPSEIEDGGRDPNTRKVAEVWEVWDKEDKIVLFVSHGCDEFLDRQADPLDIRGFFPCPKPLLANTTTSNVLPKSDYEMVKDQYFELDEVNTRISYLVEACKVVGVYDKSNDGVQTMLSNAIENQLVPVDNWAMFAERGGMKGQVDWLPIEQVAAVHQRLREARIDLMQQIYELTGISDIMRGQSAPRETATTSQLKAQYSSSRLQFMQEEVARFCQEGMRIKADLIAKHFRPQTIVQKSNIMFTPDAPYVEQAVMLLKDRWQSIYRLEVDADKLALPDWSAERNARLEYATGVGQMLGQSQQVLQAAPQLAPFVLQTLQWVAAGFKSGRQMETVLDQALQQTMAMLQQPRPDPQAEAFKAEQERENAKTQAEIQRDNVQTQAGIQQDTAQTLNDIALARMKALQDMEADTAKTQSDLALKAARELAAGGGGA